MNITKKTFLKRTKEERSNLFFFFSLFLVMGILGTLFQAQSQDVKTIVKYKKYEKVDLSLIDVKGKLQTPGDISVRNRKVIRFSRKIFSRRNFDWETRNEFNHLRIHYK